MQSSESTSPADCSEILLEDMSGRLTVDSGHCSASSASLADSTDTTNGASQQPSYIVALHRKMVEFTFLYVSKKNFQQFVSSGYVVFTDQTRRVLRFVAEK